MRLTPASLAKSGFLTGLLLMACQPAMAPSQGPRFEGDARLGDFRLVDLTPRSYSLKGGMGTATFTGPAIDGGYALAVGERLEPGFANFAGAIYPGDRASGRVPVFVPFRKEPGSADLLVVSGFEADAGVLGRLIGAVEYVVEPPALAWKPSETVAQQDLSVPVRAPLAKPCSREREYLLLNLGDAPATGAAMVLEGAGFRLTPGSMSKRDCTTWRGDAVVGGTGILSTGGETCVVKVCFDGTTAGRFDGVLRVTSKESSASAVFSVDVLASHPVLAWQQPTDTIYMVGSGERIGHVIYPSRFKILGADGGVVADLHVGTFNTAVSRGTGQGGFVIAAQSSGSSRVVHLSADGIELGSAPLFADRLFMLAPDRVLAARDGEAFWVLRLPDLAIDSTWSGGGRVALDGYSVMAAAALPDGRVVVSTNRVTTEYSSSGRVLSATTFRANQLVNGPGAQLFASSGNAVFRFESGTWVTAFNVASPNLHHLWLDRRGRWVVKVGDGLERLSPDGTLQQTLPGVFAHCPATGPCFVSGVDGADWFLGRLTD